MNLMITARMSVIMTDPHWRFPSDPPLHLKSKENFGNGKDSFKTFTYLSPSQQECVTPSEDRYMGMNSEQ